MGCKLDVVRFFGPAPLMTRFFQTIGQEKQQPCRYFFQLKTINHNSSQWTQKYSQKFNVRKFFQGSMPSDLLTMLCAGHIANSTLHVQQSVHSLSSISGSAPANNVVEEEWQPIYEFQTNQPPVVRPMCFQ